MTTINRYLIEHTYSNNIWLAYSYPENELEKAIELLNALREKEALKKYKAKLRLVLISKKIIDSD
jgi:hypothetical protein